MEKISGKSKHEKGSKLLPASKPSHLESSNDAVLLAKSILLPFQKLHSSDTFNFHVFLLQKTFLRICYCFLLVPFRFAKKEEILPSSRNRMSSSLQSNIIQQILSTILILLLIPYSLLDIRRSLATSLAEDPQTQNVLGFAKSLFRAFTPVFWMATFWLRKNKFVKLLSVCQGNNAKQLFDRPLPLAVPKSSLIWLINLVLLLAFVRTLHILIDMEYLKSHGILSICGGRAMYSFFLRDTPTPLTSDELNMKYVYEGSILAAFLFAILFLMAEFFYVFCIIGAVMIYAVCSHFLDKVKKLTREEINFGMDTQSVIRKLEELSRNYMDLVIISETINEMFGTAVVLFCLNSYSSLAWMVIDFFQNYKNFNSVLYNVHKMIIITIFNVIASEAASNMQQYKSWLLEMSVLEFHSKSEQISNFRPGTNGQAEETQVEVCLPQSALDIERRSSIRHVLKTMHRQANWEDVGLKGYKFFTVTYGFVGTMLGIIIPFAISLLQFKSVMKDELKTLSSALLSSSSRAPTRSAVKNYEMNETVDFIELVTQNPYDALLNYTSF